MKPIAVGDLVMIVKPSYCCGFSGTVGSVLVVVPDTDRVPLKRCLHCGSIEEHSAATTVRLNEGIYCERNRLKRIPPLDELEGIQTAHDLDVKEPA